MKTKSLSSTCNLLCLALLLGCADCALAAQGSAGSHLRDIKGLWLPSFFCSNMVLQRDHPIPVWGWADPDDEITVTFAGQTKTARASAGGAWRVDLEVMPASAESRTLTVVSKAGRRLAMENVLVGDVWVLSGDFGVYAEMFASAAPLRNWRLRITPRCDC